MCIRDSIGVVRHTAGHPVVATDGLQPPDLVHILESDAVHLLGAVLFQQLAQTEHALAGRMDAVSYTHLDVYKRQVMDSAPERAAPMTQLGRTRSGSAASGN